MPFLEPFRAYTKGDFLFGINATISAFIETHRGEIPKLEKSEVIKNPVVTVRQLVENRKDFEKKNFEDLRKAQNIAYLDSLEKQLKYHQQITNADDLVSSNNAKLRSKSKGALNYLIANGMHLHFLLDGLDLQNVISKNHEKDKNANDNTGKLRSVTGAELRWIFRHKDCPKTQKYVQFWIQEQQCFPPWSPQFSVQGTPNWGAYVPKNLGVPIP